MPKSTIDSELVRTLAELLNETGLTEIEYSSGEWRIRVARQVTQVVSAGPAPAVAAPAAGVPAAAVAADVPAYDASHPGAVTSPMVGTVYLSPEPGAAHFVREGDRVKEGQTLLLIEAMKTFNEIRAPRSGEVKRILAGHEQPVEYGDVLLILE